MRRIDAAGQDAQAALADLRAQLSPEGDVVSAAGRQRTLEVFGEPLSPQQVVERICRAVRTEGYAAVERFTRQLDRVAVPPERFLVSAEELTAAHQSAEPRLLVAIRQARQNILAFQLGILHRDAAFQPQPGVNVRLRYRPVRRVGCYVPGGAAAYPSTVLMTVVPAQAAGVSEIVIVTPPAGDGSIPSAVLATCRELGVTAVYRAGGAQAIAALAYGVAHLPPVDMIVGPGNLFVALAKRLVFGTVGIDMLAGPSEIVVLADATANAADVAADLIAQAEHYPGASIFITWSPSLVDAVAAELERQLRDLERGPQTRQCLEQFGALVTCRNLYEACALTNALAPEHLHIQTHDPEDVAHRITSAGALFLGKYTPVALGDYAAGPSHVLPTGGTARFASGLSANDFLRRSSVVQCDAAGLTLLTPTVDALARLEGLTGHARSLQRA